MDWTTALSTPGDWFRYGMTPGEKSDAEFYGVPGGFEGVQAGNPYAERQSSTYLGAKRWGPEAASAMQGMALGDLYDNWTAILSGKGIDPQAYLRNQAGTEAIQMASGKPEDQQRALLRAAAMGDLQ